MKNWLDITRKPYRRRGRRDFYYRNVSISPVFRAPTFLQILQFLYRHLIFGRAHRIRAFCRSPTFRCIRAIWRDEHIRPRLRLYILSMELHKQMPECEEFQCRVEDGYRYRFWHPRP